MSFVYICIAVGDPIIKRGGLGIQLIGWTSPLFCARTHISNVISISIQWYEARGDCLFCWYWWPSLLKLFFHKMYLYSF